MSDVLQASLPSDRGTPPSCTAGISNLIQKQQLTTEGRVAAGILARIVAPPPEVAVVHYFVENKKKGGGSTNKEGEGGKNKRKV